MNFADKLLNLRTQYGYSQVELAEKLNVSRQAISKWELGITLPDTDKIIAISECFNVSTDYLLKDNSYSTSNESLDRVILKFLGSAQDMSEISKELVDIMRDGVIDDTEKSQMNRIIETLDALAATIDEIKARVNMQ